MPFSDIEFHRIKKIVGSFCQERIPDNQRLQVKLFYEIHGYDVKIIESRPSFPNSHLWTEKTIARFQYNPGTLEWQLYWMNASGKWQKYPDHEPTKSLKSVMDKAAEDPYQVFWG